MQQRKVFSFILFAESQINMLNTSCKLLNLLLLVSLSCLKLVCVLKSNEYFIYSCFGLIIKCLCLERKIMFED